MANLPPPGICQYRRPPVSAMTTPARSPERQSPANRLPVRLLGLFLRKLDMANRALDLGRREQRLLRRLAAVEAGIAEVIAVLVLGMWRAGHILPADKTNFVQPGRDRDHRPAVI